MMKSHKGQSTTQGVSTMGCFLGNRRGEDKSD